MKWKLTKDKKVNIAIIFGVLLFIGLIIFIIFKFALGKNKGANVPVQLTINTPDGVKKGTGIIIENQVKTMTVLDFLNTALSFIDLPWGIIDVYWSKLTVNGKTIPLNNGKISDSGSKEKIYAILNNSIPNSINMFAQIKHTCNKNEKPTCNVCKGETAQCTANGWACVPNTLTDCPPREDIENCCTDPKNPYATCDSKTHKISCGTCPEKDKPKCYEVNGQCTTDCKGDDCNVGCMGCGPKCTPAGWVCAPNMECPPTDILNTCCTDSGEYAACSNGHVKCGSCQGDVPDCKPDCNMSGLVCGDDGKWKCEHGQICPTGDALQKCCTDPDKPVAVCDKDSGKVICKDCGPKPDHGCAESCSGCGWVCTKDGWKCQTGVSCPTDPEVLKTCCPAEGPNIPVCDTKTNCITCKCPSGSNGCGSYGCSGNTKPGAGCSDPSTGGTVPSECSKTCCPEGTPCNKNPLTHQCECCKKEQVCTVNGIATCCPDGTLCSSERGQCVAICGVDDKGDPILCGPEEECVTIENITSAGILRLKQKYPGKVSVDEKTDTAHVCMSKNTCQFSNELASPSQVPDSYYPCYPFPDLGKDDPDQPGVGYCIPKAVQYKPGQGTESGSCDNGGAKVGECDKITTSADCNKNSKCTWRNVLGYMTGEGDGPNNLRDRSGQIQCDISFLQNNPNGNFCDPSNEKTSYERVVAFQDGLGCDWTNCWGQTAQPGVIDVYYNDDTKVCAALQACNSPAGAGMNTYTTNHLGEKRPVNSTKFNSKILQSEFEACTDKPKCPVTTPDKATDQLICDYPSGMIERKAWFATKPDGQLQCVFDNIENHPSTEIQYGTEAQCYNDNCKDGAMNTACCSNGFVWDLKSQKCYQPIKDALNHDFSGMCQDTTDCNATSGHCGPAWQAHCHGSWTCHKNCCSSGADGGGPPKNPIRPYCALMSDGSWKTFGVDGYCFNEGELQNMQKVAHYGVKDSQCV